MQARVMPEQADLTDFLREQVIRAGSDKTPLTLVGGGTKAFLGREMDGQMLALGGHRGVVHYAPEELILTARSGTRLADVESLLAEHGQMLAFEPPHFGADATLGGTIAANLSGPRRAYAGAARDFVLGTRIINGRGEVLRFGGEVMKNVAGYDVSRLMAGAMGTLGVILEVSLKVVQIARTELTVVQEMSASAAIERLCQWSALPLPISASCIEDGKLYLRLEGSAAALAQARSTLGGEKLADGADFWTQVREQQHGFFAGEAPVWRVSVPPAAQPLELAGAQLIEWGGALRWLRSDADAASIRAAAAARGGHATRFRGPGHIDQPYHSLSDARLKVHQRVKHALDPERIFNPGRMYPDL
jgi:glycolate oxidase FAD binding subunit